MSTNVLDTVASPLGVFERQDELRDAGHEQIVFCRDDDSGLRAIIAIHDTTLGPGLGGTRFHPYAHESAALTDALRLSEGMTYKSAAAGMPLGGAKAVIIGDPLVDKTPALLQAYGRFVESLGGRYYTAADVGTTSADLDVMGRTSTHVVGRSVEAGGSGDSGFSTALGVFEALTAAARLTWGENGVADKTVGVEGIGKVGQHLTTLLVEAGANVVVSDPDPMAPGRLGATQSSVSVVPAVFAETLDVYAPCALGATLTPATVPSLSARIVCGAANNQLSHVGVAQLLAERSIQWVPDYVANAGGLIQVGSELSGTPHERVRECVRHIGVTAGELLHDALDQDITTLDAARLIVAERLSAGRSAVHA